MKKSQLNLEHKQIMENMGNVLKNLSLLKILLNFFCKYRHYIAKKEEVQISSFVYEMK